MKSAASTKSWRRFRRTRPPGTAALHAGNVSILRTAASRIQARRQNLRIHAGMEYSRMKDSVHLEGARCDGSGHSGCEASCLMFWKEAWLKRAESNVVSAKSLGQAAPALGPVTGLCTVESILAASRSTNSEGETIYSCQATDVPRFTSYMSFWDPRQYIRDLRSGNLDSGLARNSGGQRALDMVVAILGLLQSVDHWPVQRGAGEASPKPLPVYRRHRGKVPSDAAQPSARRIS